MNQKEQREIAEGNDLKEHTWRPIEGYRGSNIPNPDTVAAALRARQAQQQSIQM